MSEPEAFLVLSTCPRDRAASIAESRFCVFERLLR